MSSVMDCEKFPYSLAMWTWLGGITGLHTHLCLGDHLVALEHAFTVLNNNASLGSDPAINTSKTKIGSKCFIVGVARGTAQAHTHVANALAPHQSRATCHPDQK